jgi:hypothetical protein
MFVFGSIILADSLLPIFPATSVARPSWYRGTMINGRTWWSVL